MNEEIFVKARMFDRLAAHDAEVFRLQAVMVELNGKLTAAQKELDALKKPAEPPAE